jgi:hypothetical protein
MEELAEGDFRLLTDRNQSELIVEGAGIREGIYTAEATNAHGSVKTSTNVWTKIWGEKGVGN